MWIGGGKLPAAAVEEIGEIFTSVVAPAEEERDRSVVRDRDDRR